MKAVESVSTGAWARIRNVLVVTGDVMGVLVLIAVIALIGSHGEAMDLVASIVHHR
ncbi:hypothetical protein [Nocardia panacis]|uniref:hypothetical protein n=1 Tax=Nocardia panacis TaxID=2340916 RepID=UPI0013151E49|nr:hypothetical protein [Nocardia panacis]